MRLGPVWSFGFDGKKKISYHQQSRAEELIIVSSLSVCADEAEQEACTIPSQKTEHTHYCPLTVLLCSLWRAAWWPHCPHPFPSPSVFLFVFSSFSRLSLSPPPRTMQITVMHVEITAALCRGSLRTKQRHTEYVSDTEASQRLPSR